ncbi:MAG TPA: hypothetical protein PLD47_16520 [Aggregatilineales bacterium]|nr:hypothetical protein [Aggregatilineales bacterium]
MSKQILVLIGSGGIGQAIARRLLQYPHWLDCNQPSYKKDGRRSFPLIATACPSPSIS